jgi:hypothetical protein
VAHCSWVRCVAHGWEVVAYEWDVLAHGWEVEAHCWGPHLHTYVWHYDTISAGHQGSFIYLWSYIIQYAHEAGDGLV